MTSYTIATALNDGEGRFTKFTPGDKLVLGPTLVLDADGEDAALEAAYTAGNRMDPEHPWPSNVRSLSVGDVLAVYTVNRGTFARYSAVESFGFGRVDERDVLASVLIGLVNERGASAVR